MKQKGYILLVDDEDEFRDILKELLEDSHYHTTTAANAMRAREAAKNGKFDLVVLDIRLPDGDGIELLREFKQLDPDMGVIMMTGYDEVDNAVDAVRLGADDFLKKPFDLSELSIRIEEFLKKRQLIQDHKTLTRQVHAEQIKKQMIGQSAPIKKVQQTVELIGDSDSTVLITGESGTGKEVLAMMLHKAGARAKKPMVSINCGAIPEELLESELFGHVKGAFTGAIRARPGRFEIANGGTIFLDEIGDMSPKLQIKLLRVLQERCFEPVGSQNSIEVDVRIIAATHRDLEEEIEAGRFREDLFYRLNVIPMRLPPLRERNEDILLLANHFIAMFNEKKNADIQGISEGARKILLQYPWPGNVRELQNLIERIATLKRSGMVETDDLPSKMLRQSERIVREFQMNIDAADQIDIKGILEEFETYLISMALRRCNGDKAAAAKFLSLSPTALSQKIKQKGLEQES